MLLGMNNGGGVSYGCSVRRSSCNEVQEVCEERGAAGRALFGIVTSPKRPPVSTEDQTHIAITPSPRPSISRWCQVYGCDAGFQSSNDNLGY